MDIRHISAPTAFSDYSKTAISDALELAQTFGAKLSLLHVVELPPSPIEGFVPPTMGADLLGDLERQASAELAQVLPDAPEAKVEVTRAGAIGTQSQKIVETAEAETRGPHRDGDARSDRPQPSPDRQPRGARGPPRPLPGAHHPAAGETSVSHAFAARRHSRLSWYRHVQRRRTGPCSRTSSCR